MEIYYLWVTENLINNPVLVFLSCINWFLEIISSIQILVNGVIKKVNLSLVNSSEFNLLCNFILLVILSLVSGRITSGLLNYIPGKYFNEKEINIKYYYFLYIYLLIGLTVFLSTNNVLILLLLFLFLNLAVPLLIIDFKIGYLPNILTYPLLWFGFLYQMVCPNGNIVSAIYAVVLSFIMMVSITAVIEKIKRRPQMGRGDFKLIAACSAWVGILQLPYFLGFAAVLGLIHMGALYLKSANKVAMSIPFGPAIILSASFWLYQNL